MGGGGGARGGYQGQVHARKEVYRRVDMEKGVAQQNSNTLMLMDQDTINKKRQSEVAEPSESADSRDSKKKRAQDGKNELAGAVNQPRQDQ